MKYGQKNTAFSDEAGEYLEANGYSFSAGKLVNDSLYFIKDNKGVIIYGDNVDFMVFTEEEPGQRTAGFTRYMAISGIEILNLDKWKLLFQIADIIPNN